jgi:putative transcriptional regulator
LSQTGLVRPYEISATLHNWEQNRFVMEPAARTLLMPIDREPEAALQALKGPQAA